MEEASLDAKLFLVTRKSEEREEARRDITRRNQASWRTVTALCDTTAKNRRWESSVAPSVNAALVLHLNTRRRIQAA